MKNELLTIGPVTIYGYGLMIGIGIVAAYLVAEYRAKKLGLEVERIFGLTMWCVVGGFLSAKLLFYITMIKEIIQDVSLLWKLSDGFVVYGGIIGGIFTGYIFCKVKKLEFFKYFDLIMPSIALAQGFGRIGCFLAGCCYGRETSCSIGITFHNSAFAPNNISLIPTQLISSGLDFLLFFFLLLVEKKKKAHGQVAAMYLICYSIGRFILEFYRGDIGRGTIGSLSTSQFIACLLLLIGIVLFVYSSKKNKKIV